MTAGPRDGPDTCLRSLPTHEILLAEDEITHKNSDEVFKTRLHMGQLFLSYAKIGLKSRGKTNRGLQRTTAQGKGVV